MKMTRAVSYEDFVHLCRQPSQVEGIGKRHVMMLFNPPFDVFHDRSMTQMHATEIC